MNLAINYILCTNSNNNFYTYSLFIKSNNKFGLQLGIERPKNVKKRKEINNEINKYEIRAIPILHFIFRVKV